MQFKVVAKQGGNSIQFEIEAVDIKKALEIAKIEARKIFNYELGDEMPTVSVKPIKEKED